MTNCIVNSQNLVDIMNMYGKKLENLLSNLEWTELINSIDNANSCKFNLKLELEKFKRLEISAIFGQGSYSFELQTSIGNINIKNISLFNNKTDSYINLEF